jgi:hypothetical protein
MFESPTVVGDLREDLSAFRLNLTSTFLAPE